MTSFGRRALTRKLVSAIYWGQLDSTPWLVFVSEQFYDAAIPKVRERNLAEVPAAWDPLPDKPPSDSSYSDSFSSFSLSDDNEDGEGGAGSTYRRKPLPNPDLSHLSPISSDLVVPLRPEVVPNGLRSHLLLPLLLEV